MNPVILKGLETTSGYQVRKWLIAYEEPEREYWEATLHLVTAVGGSLNVFGHFDNNTSLPMVLEYPIPNTPNTKDKWSFSAGSGNGGRDQYIFKSSLGDVIFEVVNGKFECDIALTSNTNDKGCKQLTL